MEKIENYEYTAGRLRAAIRNKKIGARELVLRISNTGEGVVGLDRLLKYLNAEAIPSASLLFVLADILDVKAKQLFNQSTDTAEIALYLGVKQFSEEEWQKIVEDAKADEDDTFEVI